MAGAYGTPCSGELQFWSVMQSQLRELVKQTTRIADALEKWADPSATWRVTTAPAPEPPPSSPTVFKVGDRVAWTDPETGRKTDGWTVRNVPEIPDEGPGGDEVYTIGHDSGSEAEVHARELSYPEGGAK